MASTGRFLIFNLLVTPLFIAGCGFPPLPFGRPFVDWLSDVTLSPEVSCERLRERFALEDLPLADNPADTELAYIEYWVITPDNEALHTWYIPTSLDRGTVVLSRGSTGPMECYLYIARLLARNGWSVVMYDYRGFGLSSGRPSLDTLSEDLAVVLDWTLLQMQRAEVTLMGVSLGSIPTIAIAAERPDVVNAIVLDSPVGMRQEFDRFRTLLAGQQQELADRLAKELLTEDQMVHVRQPVLAIINAEDRVTPADTIERLVELAPGVRWVAEFGGLTHAQAPYRDPSRYVWYLDTFLATVWGGEDLRETLVPLGALDGSADDVLSD
jgi:hypothetical protein